MTARSASFDFPAGRNAGFLETGIPLGNGTNASASLDGALISVDTANSPFVDP
jgi:hypothetical protein